MRCNSFTQPIKLYVRDEPYLQYLHHRLGLHPYSTRTPCSSRWNPAWPYRWSDRDGWYCQRHGSHRHVVQQLPPRRFSFKLAVVCKGYHTGAVNQGLDFCRHVSKICREPITMASARTIFSYTSLSLSLSTTHLLSLFPSIHTAMQPVFLLSW